MHNIVHVPRLLGVRNRHLLTSAAALEHTDLTQIALKVACGVHGWGIRAPPNGRHPCLRDFTSSGKQKPKPLPVRHLLLDLFV